MNRVLSQIIIVALLVLNIEGASDLSDLWEPSTGHGSEHVHQVHDHETPAAPDIDTECDDIQDHCSHGHSASLVGQLAGFNPDGAYRFHIRANTHLLNYAQAPPTPPPNA